MAKKRRKKLSEDEAMRIALKSHPQWRSQWERGTLPDEIVGEDGQPMSPRMHITVHTIVRRQLAADESKGVVAIARELEQLGLSRHELRHAIGQAVAIHASRRKTCSTNCPRMKRAMALPCLVIEPSRSVAFQFLHCPIRE